ncbi:flagellar biosynthesis anti-sigma factor FlgM [Candidatus Poribacteria bacterium]|nr:flagellar biosynthesis anti-sigma factor FlgM [Candidatus Poribacteria bacterium]
MVPINQKGKLGSLNQVLTKKQAEKVQTNKTNPYLNTQEGKEIKAEKDGFVQSTKSSEVNRIKEKANQLPDIDLEKVEKLRQMIKDGSYTVDNQEIAENLLAAGAKLEE